MTSTILLYGATGFSGRLIAAEARAAGPGSGRVVLAGRDGAEVSRLASEHALDHRVFGLDERREIERQLEGVDVVLNAAGPFAATAVPLARAALLAGCHYVDINGEVDVYLRLDDFGYLAERVQRTLVCGAGHSAAASDVLLDGALRQLADAGRLEPDGELGTVRIAWPRLGSVSRGSARSALRSLREQVTVVRSRQRRDGAGPDVAELVLHHEPVGMREHLFDFGAAAADGSRVPRLEVAAAANVVDTLTARLTLARHRAWAHAIESYVEVDGLVRVGYPLAAALAPLGGAGPLAPLLRAPLELLPDAPPPGDRTRRHAVLLQIEDRFRTRVVDWRWETPDVYQFTAQLALEVARRTAESELSGWRTPAEVLGLDHRSWLLGARATATLPALRGSAPVDDRSR